MAELVCDGNGQIAVTALMDGVNGAVEKAGDTMTGNLEVPSLTIGGVPVSAASSSATTNIIMNAGVTRINQRNFDGVSWVVGEYGYDRWKGSSNAGKMIQVIEDGFYATSTNYTLVYKVGGIEQTPVTMESPAGGSWSIEVPVDAREILLSKGDTAGIYTCKDYVVDLFNCKRYYNVTNQVALYFSGKTQAGDPFFSSYAYPTPMRIIPTASLTLTWGSNFNTPSTQTVYIDALHIYCTAKVSQYSSEYAVRAVLDAEL